MFTQFPEEWCPHLAEIGNGNCTTLRRIQTTEERICKIIGPDCTEGRERWGGSLAKPNCDRCLENEAATGEIGNAEVAGGFILERDESDQAKEIVVQRRD